MKALTAVALAAALAGAAAAHAAGPPASVAASPTTDPAARFAVTIDPLSTAAGAALGMAKLRLQFQAALSDRFGITVAPAGGHWAVTPTLSAWGGGAELGLHLSLSNRKLSRWYLRPFASVAFATGTDTANHTSASVGGFSTGLEVGYSWTWAPGFIMNLGVGAQYSYFGASYSDGRSFSVSLDVPVLPRLNWSLGYAW
jgi:opacity protein-like surface antigen